MHRRWLTMILPLAGCAADGGGTASAGRGGASPSACFWPSQVSGFSDAGSDKALLRIGSIQMWEATLSRGCPDVDWALQIGIRARSGQAICPGRPAELIVPDPSGSASRRCLVSNIRRLSTAEADEAQGRVPADR